MYFYADHHTTANDYNVPKQSHCKFEIDIFVTNLSSINSIGKNSHCLKVIWIWFYLIHSAPFFFVEGNAPNNPGLAFIWEEEKRRRRGQDRSSQITINESQPRPENLSTSSEQYFKRRLREKLQALNVCVLFFKLLSLMVKELYGMCVFYRTNMFHRRTRAKQIFRWILLTKNVSSSNKYSKNYNFNLWESESKVLKLEFFPKNFTWTLYWYGFAI